MTLTQDFWLEKSSHATQRILSKDQLTLNKRKGMKTSKN